MFTLIKFLLSAALLIAIIVGVVYFLPSDIKAKGLEKLTGIVPASIKNKIADITLTPPEQRQQIIDKLKTNLEDLKKSEPSAAFGAIVTDSEQLLSQLQDKNNQQSLVEITEHALVNKLLNQSTTTAQCVK